MGSDSSDFRSEFVRSVVQGNTHKGDNVGGEHDTEFLKGGKPFEGEDFGASIEAMEARRLEIEKCEDPQKKLRLQKEFLKDLVATLNKAVNSMPGTVKSILHMTAEAQRRVDKVYIQENPNKLTLPKIFKEQ